jgi:hypothetical protein
MNRRASLMDVGYIMSVIVGMAFISVIFVVVTQGFNNALADDTNIPQVAKDSTSDASLAVPGMFDFWFALFFVGLPLLSAVLAYFNKIHPLLFWAGLLYSLILIFIGNGIKDLWAGAKSASVFSDASAYLPITDFVLSHFAVYVLFMVVLIAAGTYWKFAGTSSYDQQF